MKYFYNEEDTIVALSTPLGNGAIAVIRLSGANALRVINKLLKKKVTSSDARRAIFTELCNLENQLLIDEVVVTFYNSPKSYTGEDVVEISCHCNPLIIDSIIRETIKLGARIAEPGEFTFRAFMNNKLDLSRAEAVAEVIQARTHQSLNQSMRHLEGKLFENITEIKNEILSYLSLIEINLDFSDEEIEALPLLELNIRIANTVNRLQRLENTYEYGRLLQEGIKLLLIGKANVGKSSLLNLLLGKERAIVSNIPGTTRDYLEVALQIDGIAVQAVDTAGIRHTLDTIEAIGVNRTLEELKSSDIAICMFEGNLPLSEDDDKLMEILADNREGIRFIIVVNKIDLGENQNSIQKLERLDLPFLKISVLEKRGINKLKDEIKNQLIQDQSLEAEEIVVTSSRHKNVIKETIDALKHAEKAFKKNSTEEIISVDLRLALDKLGEITGETTSEDILNHIFHNFCIGK
jgi:tRNA modification GTPase